MSVTVEIAGVDRTVYVSKVAPPSWEDQLNGRGTGNITFVVPIDELGTFRPSDGQTVLIEEDLGGGPEPRFGGFLVEPESNELPIDGYVVFTSGMQDNNAIADRRIITASYVDVPVEDIIGDILTNLDGYGLSGEGVTDGGVAAGAAITIAFSTVFVTEAFNQLAVEAGGWWWNIAHDKDLTFAPRTQVSAPVGLDGDNTLKGTVTVRPVKEKYRNVEIVLAGKDDFPIVAMFEDTAEITARGTLEGTSGRYEHIEERQDILDGDLAEELAEDLVDRFGEVTLMFGCVTRVPGFASGQEVDVTFPNLELTATPFLIDSVSASVVHTDEDGTDEEIWYAIKAITGDPFGGWMEYFRKKPGPSQDRDITPEPGVTIECDPGVVVHDPPPGPVEWFQAAQTGPLDTFPSGVGISNGDPGGGGFMVLVRRTTGPDTTHVELYAIDENDEVATSPYLSFSFAEIGGSQYGPVFVAPHNLIACFLAGTDEHLVFFSTFGGGGLLGSVDLSATTANVSVAGPSVVWLDEFLFLASSNGGDVHVIDWSNPTAPVLVNTIATSLDNAQSLVLSPDRLTLYATGDAASGLISSIDVTTPGAATESDTVAHAGVGLVSIDHDTDPQNLRIGGVVRSDASNVRVTIVPVAGTTFGTPVQTVVPLATAVMAGYGCVFRGGTMIAFNHADDSGTVNTLRAHIFQVDDAHAATFTETLSYNHSATQCLGPYYNSHTRRRILYVDGSPDAQITYSVDTYPVCVDLQTQWPLEARFGGTGNRVYFAGDMLYATGAAELSRLFIGDDGQVLTVVDGLPSWQDSVASGEEQAAVVLAVLPSDVEFASSSLTDVPGLAATVASGETYYFRSELFFELEDGAAHKYAIGGTCAGDIRYQVRALDDDTGEYSVVVSGQHGALAGEAFVPSGHFVGYCEISGSIAVNGSGTLVPQVALV